MFLPPDLFARANAEQRRHAPDKPPAVAVIMCILVAMIMMLTPLFYGRRVLGRCFTTRASHPPRERIMCLTPEALELMPVTKYRTSREGKHDRAWQKGANSSITSSERSRECSICMEEFLEDIRLRSLPCGHSFHPDCIDPWLLERSVTCPMCRVNATTGLLTASKMPARPRRVLFFTELRAQRRSRPRGFRRSPCLRYFLNHSVRRAGHSNPATTFSPLSNSDADSCGSPGRDGPYVEVICGVVGVEKWKGEEPMIELGWSSGIGSWKSRGQICLSIKFTYLFHDCRVHELSEEETIELEGSEVGAKSEYAKARSECEGEL